MRNTFMQWACASSLLPGGVGGAQIERLSSRS